MYNEVVGSGIPEVENEENDLHNPEARQQRQKVSGESTGRVKVGHPRTGWRIHGKGC